MKIIPRLKIIKKLIILTFLILSCESDINDSEKKFNPCVTGVYFTHTFYPLGKNDVNGVKIKFGNPSYKLDTIFSVVSNPFYCIPKDYSCYDPFDEIT